ncbi:hypothetical protein A9995_07610 [Erythrobacter sp. QSSC1-22B]|uniref:MucR family transcriptional regulator n=1 Tax=Erythrobacter sp. QSSC1-22B TaxID=1860125 RepID=UPI0008051755|nr:MucR family transcriptional regulator [Erythrobacter sp. QSSC1-22B]OBX19598.1 hypothetical protein A9995_07610 [Erythrobacter sp. QSSC1-22B]
MNQQNELLELTAQIVESNVEGAAMSADDVGALIRTVYDTLSTLGQEPEETEAKPEPAVTVRKSLSNPDHIISMIDGKQYKTLKRHIGTYGYTPEQYRKAFNLPTDYPMVSANYSVQRAAMAKSIGLGRKPGQKAGGTKKAATATA